MTIIHVVASVCEGGVAAVVRSLIYYQNEQNRDTVVISLDNPDRVEEMKAAYGLSFRFLPVKGKLRRRFPTVFGLLSRRLYKEILKTGDSAVFHYHNPISAGLFGTVAKKSLCTIHGRMISSDKVSNFIFLHTIKRLQNKGTVLIGCSDDTKSYYENLLHTSLLSVKNGVVKPERKANAYGLSEEKINFLFASDLDRLKGWRYVLEAYNSLPEEKRNQAELYFAGAVGEEGVTDRLKDSVDKNKSIHYLGFIENMRETVLPYADIVFLPSESEGLPMTLLEALALGKIIVATPVGGIPEILTDGANGYLCSRNSGCISACMQALIDNPDLRKTFSENAEKRYEEQFSVRRMGADYETIYSKLTKRV